MRNNRFEQLSQARKKQFGWFGLGIILIWIITIIGIGFVLTHPELIGQFLGRIASGFNQTK